MGQDPVCISVVSHLQAELVKNLLEDLAAHCPGTAEVILTLNAAEHLPFGARDFAYPLEIIRNDAPRGFGANHNAAASLCTRAAFCVLNPDIRLTENPFPELLAELQRNRCAVVAPRITDPAGGTEDSARRFPTAASLLAKALGRAPALDYEIGSSAFSPDWVAGMFMLFQLQAFQSVGGFDERYFLYYEDVDICARLRRAGRDVRLVPGATAVHDARRASRRDWRHRAWHAHSMLRYLFTTGRHSPLHPG